MHLDQVFRMKAALLHAAWRTLMCVITQAHYLRLEPGAVLPALDLHRPFLALVLVRDEVTPDWQWAVSRWLVGSGCLNMAAWGIECSSWDDSVDYANLEEFSYGDIPEDRFVMTSWHEDDTLDEVIEFVKHSPVHPTIVLTEALILDISRKDHEAEVIGAWERA
jgi:hypothetical protein